MEPVREKLLCCGLAHTGDGEVVLFARGGLDSVFVYGADFVERYLNAVSGVIGAMEVETSGVEGELAGAAAEVLIVASRVNDGGERCARRGSSRRRNRIRDWRECRSDGRGLSGSLRGYGCCGVWQARRREDDGIRWTGDRRVKGVFVR